MKTSLVDRRLTVRGQGEEGFSLVELLVAIALFGVVLTALTAAFISSARSIGDQRLRTAATRLATDRLETLRTFRFDELEAKADAQPTVVTAHGRSFTMSTTVASIDPESGTPVAGGRVKQVTAVVDWTSGGVRRQVSYTTAVAAEAALAAEPQVIGTVTMFPSPATTDGFGRPLEDIEVTVPLVGFPVGTLVQVSWTNADGTAGAKTLTSATGVNWRGTIAKGQLLVPLGADGRGQLQFTVSAGSLTSVYGLAAQRVVASPPAITSAAVAPSPVTVAKPATGRSCADRNQCQNTVAVTFTVTVDGLDASQDTVIVQYQLHDRTFVEVPLSPVTGSTGQWRLVVGQRTTKFLAGTARAFRFTAVRSADGATTTTTVSRDVVAT